MCYFFPSWLSEERILCVKHMEQKNSLSFLRRETSTLEAFFPSIRIRSVLIQLSRSTQEQSSVKGKRGIKKNYILNLITIIICAVYSHLKWKSVLVLMYFHIFLYF